MTDDCSRDPQENVMFRDDVAFTAALLKKEWSLGPGHEPVIAYEPESMMMSARTGSIYLYQVSKTRRIASMDYRTLEVRSTVSIRVDNRARQTHFAWVQEVYRILMMYRRAGVAQLHGYSRLEITGERTDNDLSGWYTTTVDVTFVTYADPIRSAGFGRTD